MTHPRGLIHRFAEAQSAANTTLCLLRPVSRRQDGPEPEKSSASGATNSADVGHVDNAAQEPHANSHGADRGPGAVLSAVQKHTERDQQKRHDHDLDFVSTKFDEFTNGHSHGLKFYLALGIAP